MVNAVIRVPHKVSVIVNIWGKDNASSLFRSLQSVQKQNHKPDEVLIVIDGLISNELQRILSDFSTDSNFFLKKN